MLNRLRTLLIGMVAGFCWTMPTLAQTVTPTRGTGDVGTNISNTGSYTITGGTQQLNTLFHSFEDLSPEMADVLFQLDGNQSSVEYVIGRVTGNSTSQIDGVLELTGGNRPDLFLINPNGIHFGPNASLLLPGSLFVSTAESISFEGNVDFSSRNMDAAPLLTISAPIGLQFGTAAPDITAEGSYFEMSPGEFLGMLGGNLQFIGSTFLAESGQLSLGSVGPNSRVSLDASTFQMDYTDTVNFQDIAFTQEALADVSGDGGGRFQLQGRNVSVLESSLLEASNTGSTDGGVVGIQASEKIEVSLPFDNVNSLESAIFVDVYGAGHGNHLHLTTDQLLISELALVTTDTFGSGTAGDIVVRADDVLISGSPEIDAPRTFLGSGTFGDGQGGDVTITANRVIGENSAGLFADALSAGTNAGSGGNLTLRVDQLILRDGGQMGVSAWEDGDSGDLTVIAADSVDISGVHLISEGPASSGLFASAESGSTGNAGSFSISTPRLSIVDGGKVAGNTLGEGNGSNITIRAEEIDISESIVDFGGAISGLVANVTSEGSGHGGSLDIVTNRLTVRNGGQITTETEGGGNAGVIHIVANDIEVTGQSSDGLLRSSAITSSSTTPADAGFIMLDSDRVSVREEATISVSSLGGGNAGNLNISSNRISLNNGTLQALVTAGRDGNLNLTAESILLMRQGSQITTSATGNATGGNMSIVAPVIVGLENSDIVANAVFGSGGNIDITTQSLFGIAFREQNTPESDITSSSEFGINGTIDINNLTVVPGAALVKLPEAPADADNQVATACASSTGNQFITSGRGGLPVSPFGNLLGNRPWIDFRGISTFTSTENGDPDTTAMISSHENTQITGADKYPAEATRWGRGTDGQVALLTNPLDSSVKTTLTSCLNQVSDG